MRFSEICGIFSEPTDDAIAEIIAQLREKKMLLLTASTCPLQKNSSEIKQNMLPCPQITV